MIKLRADLPRIAGVAAAAAMLATTVVAALPAHAVDDTATVRADERNGRLVPAKRGAVERPGRGRACSTVAALLQGGLARAARPFGASGHCPLCRGRL